MASSSLQAWKAVCLLLQHHHSHSHQHKFNHSLLLKAKPVSWCNYREGRTRACIIWGQCIILYMLVACGIRIQHSSKHYSKDSIARSYAIYDYSSAGGTSSSRTFQHTYDYKFSFRGSTWIQHIMCTKTAQENDDDSIALLHTSTQVLLD